MAPSTMKALITIEGQTASVQSVPVPTPGEGEILVKVNYAAQNPTDWKFMSGSPPGRILGCDFAGTVEEANGSSWQTGQRVAGFVHGGSANPLRGAYAEYVTIDASLIFAVPDAVSDADAATLSLAVATAVQALFQRLRLPEPTPAAPAAPAATSVLIYGGTTSVGEYAVQLAKRAGLFVVATGSPRHHARLRALGADAAVDYSDADWPAQVRQLTRDGGGLAHHALDCIGEKGSSPQIARALASDGHIVTILPIAPALRAEVAAANPRATIESTIVYTVFGRPLNLSIFDNQGGETPEDKAFWARYTSGGLLSDWLAKGELQPNRTRERGGLEEVLAGFQEQKEGQVRNEKLVYKIA